MKFSNLRLIQQLAILADLAGILPSKQRQHHGRPYLYPGETTEIDTSVHGLSQPVDFFRLTRSFVCNDDDKDETVHRDVLRFDQDIKSQDVILYVTVSNDLDYREELGLGKYGIGNDLIIRNGDVKTGLHQTIKFLESFEKLLEIKDDVSKKFKQMAKQIPNAELIDESFLDRLFVNTNISCKLNVLRQALFYCKKDYYNPPFGEFYNEEDLNKLEYVFELFSPLGLAVYHYPSRDNPDASILSINFGLNGDDMVEVFCGKRSEENHTRIGAFVPTNDTDDKEFLKRIRDKIESIVNDSSCRDVSTNKLTYFLEVLESLNELIDSGELKENGYYGVIE